MNKTSNNANSTPSDYTPPSKQEILDRFWDLCSVLHGPLEPDFLPSQAAALALIPKLDVAQTEAMATRSMRADRVGTLSLCCVTMAKAAWIGLDATPDSIARGKSSKWKMDYSTLLASNAAWFFRQSVRDYIWKIPYL
jgi:hypothetical protein